MMTTVRTAGPGRQRPVASAWPLYIILKIRKTKIRNSKTKKMPQGGADPRTSRECQKAIPFYKIKVRVRLNTNGGSQKSSGDCFVFQNYPQEI